LIQIFQKDYNREGSNEHDSRFNSDTIYFHVIAFVNELTATPLRYFSIVQRIELSNVGGFIYPLVLL